MMKRLLLAIGLLFSAPGLALAQTVILVRHAEKADASADPLLSEAGTARAKALALALADAHPGYIFTSPLQRTQLTAAPTADLHAVVLIPVPLDRGSTAHAADMAARVRALPVDAVALIVGHSNTVPLIARALGYATAGDMADCEYDRLIVLDLNGQRTTAVVGRYGQASSCG